jgi:hypothetical protein
MCKLKFRPTKDHGPKISLKKEKILIFLRYVMCYYKCLRLQDSELDVKKENTGGIVTIQITAIRNTVEILLNAGVILGVLHT